MAKGKYHEWLTEDSLIKLQGWARDGLTEDQLAKNMGIGLSTLQTWKNKYKAILDALKKGKEVIDIQVENALFKKAMGLCKVKEIKTITNPDGTTSRVEIVKDIPPDTTAQIFWLKNRKPETWRDKQIVESGEETLKKLDSIMSQIGRAMHD